jgi:serine/threonine protein kinase
MSTRKIGDSDETLRSNEPHSSPHAPANTMSMGLASAQLPPELKLKDRYLIEKELGRGGIGVVYLAHDIQLMSRPVVIKVLLEDSNQDEWFKKKFRQEMEALARLNHPGIVGVLDAGQMPDGKPFLVMQYVEGAPLRSLIRYEGMDMEMAAGIIRQVGYGLTAAHEKGVYHRDLKPENIMVQLGDDEAQVKLIDFGIATVKDSQVATSRETTSVAGTVNYMAPEQLMGKPAASSDIYALGVIAYEMLTGRRPFNPATPYQLLDMQKAGVRLNPVDLRPGLPEAAQASILKALAFEPQERYPRARDFADALANALTAQAGNLNTAANLAVTKLNAKQGASTSSMPAVAAAQQVAARKKIRLYVAVAALIVLSAGAFFTYQRFLPAASSTAPPLLKSEFAENFATLERWNTPPSGWLLTKDGRLQIENQPQLIFPTEVNCEDFTMDFHLRLENDGGAAWALRTKDATHYYLFYLSGPSGLSPGYFVPYIVNGNQRTQKNAVPVIPHLVTGGEYQIHITVQGNKITHDITVAKTLPQYIDDEQGNRWALGVFVDSANTYPAGGIGFLTLHTEKYSLDDLFVRPPGVQLPADSPAHE